MSQGKLVRPDATAVGCKVFAIAALADVYAPGLWFLHNRFDTVLFGVIQRRLFAVEFQFDLRLGVRRRRPTHQRVDFAGSLGHVFKHPMLCLRSA